VIRGQLLPGGIESWTLPERETTLHGAFSLAFAMYHRYELSQEQGTHSWNVSSRGYFYQLHEQGGREIIAFHWHPGQSQQPDFAHLHIDTLHRPPQIQRKHHVPTGRVSLESVVRFAIQELGVRPLRPDWAQVLDAGQRWFNAERSW
jgi:hypothetical protein